MFYEYYRLTGDKEFLRTRVEPYFTATAACLEELLQEGPDGKLVLPVSSSPEIHDDEAASWLTPNSNYDLALLHYLFHTLVQIEYQLGNPPRLLACNGGQTCSVERRYRNRADAFAQ